MFWSYAYLNGQIRQIQQRNPSLSVLGPCSPGQQAEVGIREHPRAVAEACLEEECPDVLRGFTYYLD